MDLLTYKIVACIIVFLTSIITVTYPIYIRAYPKHNLFLEMADALASGIFLGTALFHMLPDARIDFITALGNQMTFPLAETLCAFGFLFLLFLQRLAEFRPAQTHHHTIPLILTMILIIHALIEGAVVGINSTFSTALVIFLAIIAHKSSESFALAVVLNRSPMKLTQIIVIVSLFSLMTPIGILAGTAFATLPQAAHAQLITGCFNAFAAGTFLYMSTLHHVNHHHHEHGIENLFEFGFLFLGLAIMAALCIVF